MSTPWHPLLFPTAVATAAAVMLLGTANPSCAGEAGPPRIASREPHAAGIADPANSGMNTLTGVEPGTNGAPQRLANQTLPDISWVPPLDTSDWIQLKSGEWLKGRLKAMQERVLEFDSDELDELTFNWKDVRQVRTYRIFDVLSVTGEKATGPIVVTPDRVSVCGREARVFPRSRIHSLTPGGSHEINYWSGKVTLGLDLRTGNTKQMEYNARIGLQRRTALTRFSLDYIGNLSSVNGEESANNHRVNAEFDYWVSERFYLILPGAEYYRDRFQNLDCRIAAGAGVGCYLLSRPDLEWNINIVPAWEHAWFDSAKSGEPSEKTAAALMFGSRFKWDISRRIKWAVEYRGQYTSKEAGETTHHALTTLSFDLTQRLELDVTILWDRITNPKIGMDNVEPKRDDVRLTVGLGVNF